MRTNCIRSFIVCGIVALSAPAFADMSGFANEEKANEARIQETIAQTPELSRLNGIEPDLALIFAIRLLELQHASPGNSDLQDRVLRENPEAILDLMKLIRLAAGDEKK